MQEEEISAVQEEEPKDEPINHFKKMLKTLITMRSNWRIHQAALVMIVKKEDKDFRSESLNVEKRGGGYNGKRGRAY